VPACVVHAPGVVVSRSDVTTVGAVHLEDIPAPVSVRYEATAAVVGSHCVTSADISVAVGSRSGPVAMRDARVVKIAAAVGICQRASSRVGGDCTPSIRPGIVLRSAVAWAGQIAVWTANVVHPVVALRAGRDNSARKYAGDDK
jgi:hypothetical protein